MKVVTRRRKPSGRYMTFPAGPPSMAGFLKMGSETFVSRICFIL